MTLLSNCKLTYFGIVGGRVEACRLALSLGNIAFQDDRISFPEWKDFKPKTPFGSVPVLTLEDGTQLAQQRAILRLIGKETNLYPTSDHLLAAKVDSLVDATEDLFPKTNAVGQGLPQTEKEAARKAAIEQGGEIYAMLQKIDAFVAANGSNGFAVGSSLTIADLVLFSMTGSIVSGLYDGIPLTAMDAFANITTVRKTVRAHPGVVKYFDGLDDAVKEKIPGSFQPLV